MLEDVVQVVALARGARTQVAALGAQGDGVAVVVQRRQRVGFAGRRVLRFFFLAADADLDQPELDVVDRQGAVHGLLMEAAQHAAGQFGLFAFDGDAAAATRQLDAHAIGQLAQVLVQRAAQVGQVLSLIHI